MLRLNRVDRRDQEMAENLGLSVRTIERHIANIYLKIDAHKRAEATAFALRHGLTPASNGSS